MQYFVLLLSYCYVQLLLLLLSYFCLVYFYFYLVTFLQYLLQYWLLSSGMAQRTETHRSRGPKKTEDEKTDARRDKRRSTERDAAAGDDEVDQEQRNGLCSELHVIRSVMT